MSWFRKTPDEPYIEYDPVQDEKMARLEQAEAEVADLKARSARAVQFLDARRNRNHWAETVQSIIQGA